MVLSHHCSRRGEDSVGARPCLGCGRKRGQHDQALGRSRGGFSTKIHLKTDFGGLPIAFHLTGGEASDSRNFETLLDIGPDLNPRAALGDEPKRPMPRAFSGFRRPEQSHGS